MEGDIGTIIEQQQLENGMELILFDRSRVMTADRLVVDLLCEAKIPIADSFWEIGADEDPQLHHAIREMLGEKLVFAVNRKRNFVDAAERETVLQEMVHQVYASILEYLKRPDFPRHLFKKQYRDAKQKVLLQQAMKQSENQKTEDS